MVKYIFFDLDDTIFDFHKAERIALKRALDGFGIEASDEKLQLYSEINNEQWKRLERKEITRSELKIIRFRIFLDRIGANNVDAIEVGKTYESLLAEGHYYLDNALEVVKGLSKDYRLFMVSNGLSAVQRGRLKDSEVKDYFEKIFISEEMGESKPQKEYFDMCFEDIENFDKRFAVIVGDSLSSDIQGGINAGIRTVWFNKEGKKNNSPVKPNYEISLLDELFDLLKTI